MNNDARLVAVLATALDTWLSRPPPREQRFGKYEYSALLTLATGNERHYGSPVAEVFGGLIAQWGGTADQLIEAMTALTKQG